MIKYLLVLISLISSFSINAEGISLNCSSVETQCLNCGENKTIFPLNEFSKDTGSLDVTADESEILNSGAYHFNGDVELKSDVHILSADDIKVLSADESALASGNVKFQDKDFLISSNELQFNKDLNGISVDASNAYFQDISVGTLGANGSGSRIIKTPNNIIIENATYTLCPVSNSNWVVEASTIKLDLDKNRGNAKNAKIEFYGIPILYLPRYSWVLKGRGSGFLTPSYQTFNDSTTKKGAYTLKVPYYFDIAPDRDLLIAATYLKYRGFKYEGKYRQLFGRKIDDEGENVDSIIKIDARYMSNDSISKINRWFLESSLVLDITDKFNFSSNYNRVSDKKYIKEIARGTKAELNSQFKLSYQDKTNALLLQALREFRQVLDGCETACQDKYTRNYELLLDKTFTWEEENRAINTVLKNTKFTSTKPNKVSGTRTYLNIGFTKDHLILEGDDIYPAIPLISSKLNFSSTHYNLNNSKNITRNIGGAGLDLLLPFKNRGSFLNAEISHILIPKISYKYRGTKAQSSIPLFDTTDSYVDIMTFSDLTADERYTGLDRISNANDITYSIESGTRFIDSEKTDPDLLNFKLAQTYYTDDYAVSNITNNDYEIRRKYSNIASSIAVALDNFTFSNNTTIEPDNFSIVSKSNSFSYRVNSRKFITLEYSHSRVTNDDKKRTIKMYGALPLTDSIHIFGGRDKITSTNALNTETSGIVYESCCWAFRLAHIKKAASNDYNYSTVAEIILKGLGSTAASLNERIETNIPGYVAELN
tara:strand:+ start:271 stop:2577 length:2307 start_codon:yes stop_codon:yes gene_type:complete